jgi:hypothetical protein
VAQHALGRGRTADVAGADEEDADVRHLGEWPPVIC